MNLIEADAKQILEDYGLPVPGGRRLLGAEEALPARDGRIAVKAQLLSGGRGKAGLVRLASPAEAADALGDVRSAMAAAGHAPLVMIEDCAPVGREFFLAWRLDGLTRSLVLMFSLAGGVEVEAQPGRVQEAAFDPLSPPRLVEIADFLRTCGLEGPALAAVSRFALDLCAVMVREDAVLVEINPLTVTPAGAALALDAKMVLDDNAARRHREWARLPSARLQADTADPLEQEGATRGVTFVRLEGEVALLTGGAGLGMALIDLLADAGLGAANFVDVPGGSGADVFGTLAELVLRRAAEPGVKAILIFLTLSATSLKAPVESLLAAIDARPPPRPLIVGLVAGGSAEREMTLAEAQAAFRSRGHECVLDLESAAAAAVRAARS
jgi:succinyl-CoA synthetase beta subunit